MIRCLVSVWKGLETLPFLQVLPAGNGSFFYTASFMCFSSPQCSGFHSFRL